MAKKFIQNIQKLIEEKDPKKDLGLVSEGNIKHFQAKPPALVSTLDPNIGIEEDAESKPITSKSLIWTRELFFHDKGDFKSLILEDFFVNLQISKTIIPSSPNGNFIDNLA